MGFGINENGMDETWRVVTLSDYNTYWCIFYLASYAYIIVGDCINFSTFDEYKEKRMKILKSFRKW